jgi:hypothetical protein
MLPGPGDCFRCGEYGHWSDSETCTWLRKAATRKEHEARIDNLTMRWHDSKIATPQKREYIRRENELWKAGSKS